MHNTQHVTFSTRQYDGFFVLSAHETNIANFVVDFKSFRFLRFITGRQKAVGYMI